ncbi:MAG: DUF72 domain-containing protein [Ferruginibacter sp.]
MEWLIGCAGFNYPQWKKVFYPDKLPQRLWLSHYATQFNTLEVNATFYKLPTPATLLKWYDTTPANFVFTVKAPRNITHYKNFINCSDEINGFYKLIGDGLKDKLGCILFQLPPKFSYTKERLQLIIDNLTPQYNNVVEFRHISWWQQAIISELEGNNIIFAGHSHPNGVPDEVIINREISYYRFHGVPNLFYSAYDEAALMNFANTMLKCKAVTKAYVYFNNTASMAAIENAFFLKGYLNKPGYND